MIYIYIYIYMMSNSACIFAQKLLAFLTPPWGGKVVFSYNYLIFFATETLSLPLSEDNNYDNYILYSLFDYANSISYYRTVLSLPSP